MTTKRTSLDRIVEEELLTAEQAEQLMAAGIEDGPHLVKAWRDPAERPRLAEAVGSTVKELMPAVFVANLLQQEAPGVVGIDVLLQFKDETIPGFEDNEKDHEFVYQGRQGIIGYVGYWIYQKCVLENVHSYRSTQKFSIWLVGLGILVLLGLIVYNYWNALSGNFGPDVTSQLAQALNRREALQLAGWIMIILGGGLAIIVGGLSIMDRVRLWFDITIDRKMGLTPRDMLVWLEAQKSPPPAWIKVDQILDRVLIFIWGIPILVGVFLPGVRVWAYLLISGLLLFSWMLLRIKSVSVRFSQITSAWAQQARPHQARLLLVKAVVAILLIGFASMVWFTSAGLLFQAADAWTHAQVQSARNDLQIWLEKQTLETTDPGVGELEQFIWDMTQTWIETKQKTPDIWNSWLPVVTQLISVGLFSIASGSAFGWYYFIRHKRFFKALLFLTILYLVLTITPVVVSFWLLQAPQGNFGFWYVTTGLLDIFQKTAINNLPGLTVGLFLALGQDVFDSVQEKDLDHECPKCHLLYVTPDCKCKETDSLEKVLTLQEAKLLTKAKVT